MYETLAKAAVAAAIATTTTPTVKPITQATITRSYEYTENGKRFRVTIEDVTPATQYVPMQFTPFPMQRALGGDPRFIGSCGPNGCR
jgi:hypothetical protein